MQAVVSIAGSDCSGGAGIQADLKTMLAQGVYGMSVITAITAQNTTGVKGSLTIPEEMVREQLLAVLEDIPPNAVKIGMLPDIKQVEIVAELLKQYGIKNVVLDPVMVATAGDTLVAEKTISVMKEMLFPLCEIITPNLPEAEILLGRPIRDKQQMEQAAEVLSKTFGCGVLIKGGHATEHADDYLYAHGQGKWFIGARVENPNNHGTGCTLSSAIASQLALGNTLEDAVKIAKDYVRATLEQNLNLGQGSGPLAHGLDWKWKK